MCVCLCACVRAYGCIDILNSEVTVAIKNTVISIQETKFRLQKCREMSGCRQHVDCFVTDRWSSNNNTPYSFKGCGSRWAVYVLACSLYGQAFIKPSGDHRVSKRLTHWGRVTHICVSRLTIIDSIMVCRLVGAKPLSEPMLKYS